MLKRENLKNISPSVLKWPTVPCVQELFEEALQKHVNYMVLFLEAALLKCVGLFCVPLKGIPSKALVELECILCWAGGTVSYVFSSAHDVPCHLGVSAVLTSEEGEEGQGYFLQLLLRSRQQLDIMGSQEDIWFPQPQHALP